MKPAVNQVELHPGNPSPKLVAYCQAEGIHVSGYSPLGSTESPFRRNETIKAVAEAHGKTPSQVLLMWGLQKGWSVLPKSVTPARIEENFDLDGWELTEEEMASIDAMPERFKICGDSWLPAKVFFGDGN